MALSKLLQAQPTLFESKTGSASRTGRVAKYNQLLRIEEDLMGMSQYAGARALSIDYPLTSTKKKAAPAKAPAKAKKK
jgi:hypothetical protein